MMKKMSALIVLSVLILPHYSAFASEQGAPEIHFGGFVDSYYLYNFNHPRAIAIGTGLPAGNNTYHYYDNYSNQLSVSLVELSPQVKYNEVTFNADLDFGPFADLNSSADEVSKHIGQALVSYRATGSRFLFEAGKMYTHVGLEIVKSKDNFNYSRSMLMVYAMPFWHTGVHIAYDAIPEKLQTSVYVYNGWNSIYDNNNSKTIGAQLKYNPTPSLTVIYNYLGGPERTADERDWKVLYEANASWNANSKWTLGADLLSGSDKNAIATSSGNRDAKWYGGEILAKWQITDSSYVSPRYEVYRDQDGYTLSNGPQTIHSATLTYGRFLAKGLEVRTESRYDKSNRNTLIAGSGNKDSQATLSAALLFGF